MESIQDILKNINVNTASENDVQTLLEKHKYVTKEYQDYGYRLAIKLGDLKRVSMYIKLAKDRPRTLLEQAYSFSIDYPNAQSKNRIFLWKLKQLWDEYKNAKGIVEEKKPRKRKKKSKTSENLGPDGKPKRGRKRKMTPVEAGDQLTLT